MAPWIAALVGAGVSVLLSGLAFAAAWGALSWRMRAAEARLKRLEGDRDETLRVVSQVGREVAGLASTVEGLSRVLEHLKPHGGQG